MKWIENDILITRDQSLATKLMIYLNWIPTTIFVLVDKACLMMMLLEEIVDQWKPSLNSQWEDQLSEFAKITAQEVREGVNKKINELLELRGVQVWVKVHFKKIKKHAFKSILDHFSHFTLTFFTFIWGGGVSAHGLVIRYKELRMQAF